MPTLKVWEKMHRPLTHVATAFTYVEWSTLAHEYLEVGLDNNGVVRAMKSSALRDAALALARYADLCAMWGTDSDHDV